MSDDSSKKIVAIAGASAVIFGSAFGVVATDQAKAQIASKQSFREKLEAIKTAVERNELSSFTADGEVWQVNEQRDVGVAQWVQSWDKQTWKKQA
jgi:hypothetical protein